MEDKRDRLLAPTEHERNASKDAAESLIKRFALKNRQEQAHDDDADRTPRRGAEQSVEPAKKSREVGMGGED